MTSPSRDRLLRSLIRDPTCIRRIGSGEDVVILIQITPRAFFTPKVQVFTSNVEGRSSGSLSFTVSDCFHLTRLLLDPEKPNDTVIEAPNGADKFLVLRQGDCATIRHCNKNKFLHIPGRLVPDFARELERVTQRISRLGRLGLL